MQPVSQVKNAQFLFITEEICLYLQGNWPCLADWNSHSGWRQCYWLLWTWWLQVSLCCRVVLVSVCRYVILMSIHLMTHSEILVCRRDSTFYLNLCRWLAVIIYWLLIFIVAIILLNILIAQFSQSYEEQRGVAHVSVTLTRTKLLHKMETALWTRPILKVYIFFKTVNFREIPATFIKLM